MSEGWAGLQLDQVASNGDLTQLYPAWCTPGADPTAATPADMVREPTSGELTGLQVETNLTDGGVLELYDFNGADVGADVSSSNVITDAELQTALTAGLAKLIYRQNFAATGLTPPNVGYLRFMKGLAARFVANAGECYLNLKVTGGYRKIHGSV